MALLDVSDVLDDPDFASTIVVRPMASTIGENGLAQATVGSNTVSAVVIPDGGDDLVQTGEGDAVQGDITIYTRWPLTTGDAERAADIVEWDGGVYVLINAQAWRYGSGYYRAVAKLATLNSEQAPPDDAGFLG